MRVIKSSNLIREVLDRVPLSVSYFIVGRLKTTEIYNHMPFKVVPDDRSTSAVRTTFSINIITLDEFRLQYEMNGVSHDGTYKFGKTVVDDGLYFELNARIILIKALLRCCLK